MFKPELLKLMLENDGLEGGGGNPTNIDPTPIEPTPAPQDFTLEQALELIKKADSSTLLQIPGVVSLVENARKQEKDKVYKSLAQKDDTIKALQDEMVELKNTMNTKEKEKMDETQVLMTELKKLQDDQQNLRSELRKKELEAYTASKLRDAGDEIVLELVGGNSEEEIDSSIEKAKTKYQDILSRAKAQVESPASKPPAKPVPVTNPSGHAMPNIKDVRTMSYEEYAKNRDALLKGTNLGE
jgi:DNA repair exonuclease SbcCD ATPase subunit